MGCHETKLIDPFLLGDWPNRQPNDWTTNQKEPSREADPKLRPFPSDCCATCRHNFIDCRWTDIRLGGLDFVVVDILCCLRYCVGSRGSIGNRHIDFDRSSSPFGKEKRLFKGMAY